jgi:UDP-4-amino-4,6-dideoxy-N-acetyl-beta-L-altrosamine N-acetyltransferase
MEIDKHKIYEVEDYKFVNFVNLDDETIEKIRIWRNHPDIRKRMYSEDEISAEAQQTFVCNLKNSTTKYYWLVYRAGIPVGVVSVADVDRDNNTANSGLYLIPEYQGHGLGLNFVFAVHYFFFHNLKIETLISGAAISNDNILICDSFLGFKIDFNPILINKQYFYNVTCSSSDFMLAYKKRNDLKAFAKHAIEYRRFLNQRKTIE